MKPLYAFFLLPALLLLAQTPHAFEVASVKPDPWPGRNSSVGVFVKNDTLTADHSDLYGLVEFAYNLRDGHLSGGPAWAKAGVLNASDLYYVVGKASGDPPPPIEQFRSMLQTLLADRFHLEVRHVQKELPTFNLVVSPHGLKLKESAQDAKFNIHQNAAVNHGHSNRSTGTHVTIAQFIESLCYYAGRPVFDHTGLTGFYDLEIAWDLDDSAFAMSPDAIGQTFQTAVEKQLGLKLEPSTGSFDTVVIDHAEKPTSN